MDLVAVEQVVRPRGRAELPDWRPGDAWLAGGSWLFSEPQRSVTRLIDLQSLDWPPIVADADGLELAATCTLAQLAAYPMPAAWPAAAIVRPCCEALLGSFKVWNVATVGGNLCLALPAGAVTSLCAGLDGIVTVWTPDGGSRALTVPELVTGNRATSLAPGELVRSVRLPAAALAQPAAVRQFSLTELGRSAALLVGRRTPDGLTLTITASTTRPLVIPFIGSPNDGRLAAVIDDTVAGRWHDDVHGHPRWRAHLTHRLAREIRDELACG